MPCLSSLTKSFFTAAVLGCLGVGGLTVGAAPLLVGEASPDDTSHRGSGRLVTQVPTLLPTVEPGQAIAYRGTGRIQQSADPLVSHRGSGRIDEEPAAASQSAYRGSGRIAPDGLMALA